MALFEKKFCDLCNDKVNVLTRLKLSDGYLCSDCKHKLSSLSSNWDNRTIDDVKAHLEAREKNKQKYSQFACSARAGKSSELMVDASHRWFCFSIGSDYKEGNPEVFDFSQLQDFWLEPSYSSPADSDNDGIPDSRDSFNNTTGQVTNNGASFGNMFMNAMTGMNGMNMNMNAAMNVQQYMRSSNSAFDMSTGMQKEIRSLKALFRVNHPYITDVSFYVDSSITDQGAELMQAYNYAAQIMQLCEQIRGSAQQQPMQQGFNQQPMQQGFNQQPMQQGFNQQPVQQGFNQQPVQQGFNQQPVQQAAAVMPFCQSCGAQNSTGAAFCPGCGAPLRK